MHDHHDALDSHEWQTCSSCSRRLRHDEDGRIACRICQQRVDRALWSLAGPVVYEHSKQGGRKIVSGLYAALTGVMAPGASKGNVPVSGSRTAPLPLRLEPLSLTARGGIVTILQTWQIDWHEHLGWAHPRWNGDLQQQLDNAVAALRGNLTWAAGKHPAFDEFASEVSGLVRQCERQITGERTERPISVTCPCGTVLHITVSTPGARCRGCGTQHTRSALLDLPLAQRAALCLR